MNNWKSAKEKLPEKEGRYLCVVYSWFKDGEFCGEDMQICYFELVFNWTIEKNNDILDERVVYWVELPETPIRYEDEPK